MKHSIITEHILPRLKTNALKTLIKFAASIGLSIKIVNLTGGPCAGKTESLLVLEREFTKRGFQTIILPEAATIVRNSGFRSEEGFFSDLYCQKMMIRLNEENLINAILACLDCHVAGTEKQVLIIRDRCSIDGAAYVPDIGIYEALLSDMGLSVGDLECSDVTVFLRSLAYDNPELYDICSGNNTARFENADQAKKADEKLLSVYELYAHPYVIDNSTSFEEKLRRVVDIIVEALGEPKLEKELAFMVESDVETLLSKFGLTKKDPVEITQFYMPDGDRYRQIVYPGGIHRKFVHTRKQETENPAVRIEIEAPINQCTFLEAESHRDKNKSVIKKQRYSRVIQTPSGYYVIEIDSFSNGVPEGLLRLEVEYGLEKPDIGHLLQGLNHVDVSGRSDCSNSSIAEGKFPIMLI